MYLVNILLGWSGLQRKLKTYSMALVLTLAFKKCVRINIYLCIHTYSTIKQLYNQGCEEHEF